MQNTCFFFKKKMIAPLVYEYNIHLSTSFLVRIQYSRLMQKLHHFRALNSRFILVVHKGSDICSENRVVKILPSASFVSFIGALTFEMIRISRESNRVTFGILFGRLANNDRRSSLHTYSIHFIDASLSRIVFPE